ncbi:MAG: hypothetical protein FJX55_21370 [Alphaproteobacteria bacterium]|nr:hypothetical protein [Alphaproteobacteria bacterium]
MRVELLRLGAAERTAMDVLFAAPFAPLPGEPPPALHPTVGIRPRYHHEIFTLLQGLGLKVTSCRDLADLPAALGRHNYVFSLYSRAPFRNCEVYVPALCEAAGIAYMGAPPNIRAMAEDKYLSKALALAAGLPVPPGRPYVSADDLVEEPDFAGPYFVKYRFGSASEDVSEESVQASWRGARERARALLAMGKEVLVERCIAGTDMTVPVLGGPVPLWLPAAEEISDLPYGIATFRQKRFLKQTRRRRIVADGPLAERLGNLSLSLAQRMLPFDYMRADYRCETGTGEIYFIETNIACNLGSTAAIAQSAAQAGLSHAAIIEHILVHSVRRQGLQRTRLKTDNI